MTYRDSEDSELEEDLAIHLTVSANINQLQALAFCQCCKPDVEANQPRFDQQVELLLCLKSTHQVGEASKVVQRTATVIQLRRVVESLFVLKICTVHLLLC